MCYFRDRHRHLFLALLSFSTKFDEFLNQKYAFASWKEFKTLWSFELWFKTSALRKWKRYFAPIQITKISVSVTRVMSVPYHFRSNLKLSYDIMSNILSQKLHSKCSPTVDLDSSPCNAFRFRKNTEKIKFKGI